MRLWDLTRTPLGPIKLRGPAAPNFYDLIMTRDGRWLAAAGEDGAASAWDLAAQASAAAREGEPSAKPPAAESSPAVRSFRAGQIPLMSVDFSRDGRWLAAGSQDGSIWLWSLTESADAPRLVGRHEGAVFSVGFDGDSRWLVSGGLEGTVRLDEIRAAGPASDPLRLHDAERNLDAMCLSPGGHLLVTSDYQGKVFLWDLRSDDPREDPVTLEGQPEARSTLAVSPDARWLARGGERGVVQLWTSRPRTACRSRSAAIAGRSP